MPAEFLHVAEEAGLMPGIDRWVLGKACRDAAHWLAEGYLAGDVMISVNVAPSELLQPDFVGHVATVLRETGLPARQLKLEILETGLLEEDDAGRTLTALRELGVKIAIDDFGAGHSSLDYLRKFDVDTLKIDRQLVVGLRRISASPLSFAALRQWLVSSAWMSWQRESRHRSSSR
jgi:EAL domain-containing protein (putative c-di-GMP-specific phosphodiesterase class I)